MQQQPFLFVYWPDLENIDIIILYKLLMLFIDI